ncbi:hypothetical protein [Mycolicibacterium sp.]|uniref:hypothetical protein n=1 Tax=Mycolicibacterium sp. TaxID=2320850 RepID=UPI0035611EF8
MSLAVLAKAALITFLVIATVTVVAVYIHRLRHREPRPSWPPTESVYRNHVRTPLPPWVDEYGHVIDDDGDGGGPGRPPQAGQA